MQKRSRILLFWSIFLLNFCVKGFLDVILNPILIVNFGYWISLLITTSIYLYIGIKSVNIYDFYKVDCLFIETLKKIQFNNKRFESKNVLIKFILKRSETNKFLLGLLLSFKNPGLVVIYFRDGFNLYNGFSGKNIKLFFALYLLITNIYWNLTVLLGIGLFKFLWIFVKGLF